MTSTAAWCGALGITPVIAERGEDHGSGLDVIRWVVERTIASRLRHDFQIVRFSGPPCRACRVPMSEKETGNSIDRLVRPGQTAARYVQRRLGRWREGLEVSVPQPSTGFGEELRKRRLEAGLSLTALSGSVHYSKAQLSKVERGLKAPSRDLARLCDAALGESGTAPQR